MASLFKCAKVYLQHVQILFISFDYKMNETPTLNIGLIKVLLKIVLQLQEQSFKFVSGHISRRYYNLSI
jgi:hypothetical protein